MAEKPSEALRRLIEELELRAEDLERRAAENGEMGNYTIAAARAAESFGVRLSAELVRRHLAAAEEREAKVAEPITREWRNEKGRERSEQDG